MLHLKDKQTKEKLGCNLSFSLSLLVRICLDLFGFYAILAWWKHKVATRLIFSKGIPCFMSKKELPHLH